MKIKALRTDRGREYLLEEYKVLCDEKAIQHQLRIPKNLQQNGVVERRNETLIEMVRSLMVEENLPISFWGGTLLTAPYILNQVPSRQHHISYGQVLRPI